jgi:hypothetical protein
LSLLADGLEVTRTADEAIRIRCNLLHIACGLR